MSGSYLLLLLATLFCLGLIDYRWQLAIFSQRRRAVHILAISIIFFVLWDIAGIVLNIFYIGVGKSLSGIRLGQFPLEEVFFLAVLCYNALLIYAAVERKWSKP